MIEHERVISAASEVVDSLERFRKGDKSDDLGAIIGRLELTVKQLRLADPVGEGGVFTPDDALLSLYMGYRGKKFQNNEVSKRKKYKGDIIGWVKDVIFKAMDYYNAEVADCGDDDCPVCTTMIGLKDVLGGLVTYPENGEFDSEVSWKMSISNRKYSAGKEAA